jgi:hypothetical protein
MNKWILVVISLIRSLSLSGSESKITASVLTLDPGREIYSIFGHTAIRIVNNENGTDRVYNFGTFDFDDRWFYLKFIKGNLKYFLSVNSFDNFIIAAESENRRVYEEQLNISDSQAKAMEEELSSLYHSPERFYTYDFFHDNCATRVRDQIFSSPAILRDTSGLCCTSFRNLLIPFISHKYWLNLGINLAMGKKADVTASAWDHMFLPVYISSIIKKTGTGKSQNLLLSGQPEKKKKFPAYAWPWIILIIVALSQVFRPTRKIAYYLFFGVLSLTGLILLFVSIISINPVLSGNLNLVWLLPSILILASSSLKAGKIIRAAYIILVVILFAFWNQLPQALSTTFLPWMSGIILLLAVEFVAKDAL